MHGSYTTQDDIKAGYGAPSRDLQLIKARQDDYWNKITLYNQKIHALEVQEAALKKKRDQMQLRQLLTEQVNSLNNMKSNERESDIQKAHETQRKLELDRAKDKQAQLEKKKKL